MTSELTTSISIETTSKSSAISTEDDLYKPHTIVPLIFIAFCLLVNYIITLLAMTLKGGKDFDTSYYVIAKYLAISDFGVLTAAAMYMGDRLSSTTDERDFIMRIFWVYSAAVGYFPGLCMNWLITLNRFTAIVFFSKYRIWFTVKRTRYAVALTYTFSFIEITGVSFMPYWLQHYFYIGMAGTTISLYILCYPICIVVSIIRMRSNSAAHDKKKFLVEIKLLAQAILIGCLVFLQEFLFQVTAGALIYEIFYMLYGGLNPLIYLSLDVKIRRAYFKFLGCKVADGATVVPTSTVVVNNQQHISVIAAPHKEEGRDATESFTYNYRTKGQVLQEACFSIYHKLGKNTTIAYKAFARKR
uniref:7TM GPCR serpentine receptor class x (Srx) domain-containing protein n=1 Tax=Romanomermis culicivorax TaxID=13658 RepID=A0A915J8B0_ROMCU